MVADKTLTQKGFHEIIPGLGAFPVRPSGADSRIGELKVFINQVIEHFVNHASQREKLAYRIFDIYKNEEPNQLKDPIPAAFGVNRALIPDDTFVLVGYYDSEEQYKWIRKRKLYNFRMGSGRGSLILDKETVDAKYLLLHTKSDKASGDIWRIRSKGPKVYSREDLLKRDYPDPSQDHYLVLEIEQIEDEEFKDCMREFKKLGNYSPGRASAFPFTASLTELMSTKIK